jgi:hypothetical protein
MTSNGQFVEFNPEIASILVDAEEKKGRKLTEEEFLKLMTPILERAFDRKERLDHQM